MKAGTTGGLVVVVVVVVVGVLLLFQKTLSFTVISLSLEEGWRGGWRWLWECFFIRSAKTTIWDNVLCLFIWRVWHHYCRWQEFTLGEESVWICPKNAELFCSCIGSLTKREWIWSFTSVRLEPSGPGALQEVGNTSHSPHSDNTSAKRKVSMSMKIFSDIFWTLIYRRLNWKLVKIHH